jgi:hypothetical protein
VGISNGSFWLICKQGEAAEQHMFGLLLLLPPLAVFRISYDLYHLEHYPGHS